MAIKYFGDNSFRSLLQLLKTKFDTKVDKVEGKSLVLDTEIEKLSGVEAGANKYVHPTHTEAASGLYKVTVDAEGHVTATAAVTKDDLVALGLPAQDTTYSEATQGAAGLMSAADKTKLDGVEEGAQVNVQADWSATEGAAAILNKPNLATVATSGSYRDLSDTPVISTDIVADAASDDKTASPKAVKTYVDSKISSTYKAAGSATLETLPAGSAENLGYVYNMTAEFTTTEAFVEGLGTTYPVGTNVVVVEQGGAYKYDVLAGFVDLSAYAKTEDITEYGASDVEAAWNEVFTA